MKNWTTMGGATGHGLVGGFVSEFYRVLPSFNGGIGGQMCCRALRAACRRTWPTRALRRRPTRVCSRRNRH